MLRVKQNSDGWIGGMDEKGKNAGDMDQLHRRSALKPVPGLLPDLCALLGRIPDLPEVPIKSEAALERVILVQKLPGTPG